MTDHDKAAHALSCGAEYPYDAPDEWKGFEDEPYAYPATDQAHAAARGIIADLSDRRGIKRGFEEIDEEIRQEIVETLAQIIRLAMGLEIPEPKDRVADALELIAERLDEANKLNAIS